MTSQHTPGPWEVENCGVGKQANKLFIWQKKGGGQDFHAIATVHEDLGNQWANARLIVAAPDLLNALMVAAIHLEGIATGKATKASDFDMAYIKAAIAKARP